MPVGVYVRTEKIRKSLSESRKGRTHKGQVHSDETKRKIAASLTGKKASEETRRKQSLAQKGNQYCLGHRPSEETRQKMSDYHRSHENPAKRPDVRAKISASKQGPLNAAWRGGKSFEPYCPAFSKKLKEEIRDLFERRCGHCGNLEESGRKHPVHHIDYNKMQGCGKHRRWNLVPLCHRCHARSNFNRWYWFSVLYTRWAMKDEFSIMGGFGW